MTVAATQLQTTILPAQRADEARLTGVGIALLSALAVGPSSIAYSVPPEFETIGSLTFVEIRSPIDAQPLVHELGALHDRLLAQTTELDPEAKAVLYANLWSLYTA